MTGLVMEIKNSSVVVMTNEGGFEEWTLETNKVSIGQELEKPAPVIQLTERRSWGYRKVTAIAASVLLMISMSGIGLNAYNTPVGYVNIDINPSVELTYNQFERIIDMRALNEDGALILNANPSLKNLKVKKAIHDVIETSKKQGYIVESEENYILITTTSLEDDDADIDLEISEVERAEETENLVVEVIESDIGNFKDASNSGISPGKNILIKRVIDLKKANEEIFIESENFDKDSSVGEIIRTIVHEEKKNKDKKSKNNLNNQKQEKNEENIESPEGEGIENFQNNEKPNKDDNPVDKEKLDKQKNDNNNNGKGNGQDKPQKQDINPEDKKPKDKDTSDNQEDEENGLDPKNIEDKNDQGNVNKPDKEQNPNKPDKSDKPDKSNGPKEKDKSEGSENEDENTEDQNLNPSDDPEDNVSVSDKMEKTNKKNTNAAKNKGNAENNKESGGAKSN